MNTSVADSIDRVNLTVLPFGQDILTYTAQHLVSRYEPPDLSHCHVILPDMHNATWLRHLLLVTAREQGNNALLGPEITTIDHWLNRTIGLQKQIASPHTTRLMLIESLRDYPHLYGNGGPWALADSLMTLFEELSQQSIQLPHTIQDFSDLLSQAYQLPASFDAVPLTREATLVHTLWRAWQRQLAENNAIDPEGARVERLLGSTALIKLSQQFIFIGLDQLTRAQADWVKILLQRNQAEFIIHGTIQNQAQDQNQTLELSQAHIDPLQLPHYHNTYIRLYEQLAQQPFHPQPDHVHTDAFDQFIERVFDQQAITAPGAALSIAPTIAQRAQQFALDHPFSPAQERLHLIKAATPEQQARIVDVNIRRWLLEGKRHIAIICADTRLSRRLRALLERANVHLRDQNGWTLSTSRVAAVLERLLQTAEEDYDHKPLLDLLKSPFLLPHWDEHERLAATWRLEHDIIENENIARGLQRYRHHITWRQNRLEWPADLATPVTQLLDVLEQAIAPLHAIAEPTNRPASEYLQALDHALHGLGLDTTCKEDPAGQCLLEQLQALRLAVADRTITLSWLEFRNWLGQSLEQARFSPPLVDDGRPQVQLLTLTDTPYRDYDAIIFASADQTQLPATRGNTPFFNDSVRHELGLEVFRHHQERQLARFRNLLQRAPEIIISWHQQDGDNPVNPSPWVEIIETFHRLAYGQSLEDPLRLAIGLAPQHQVILCDVESHLEPVFQPAPIAINSLPASISASSYQRLVDCPYLFYAADCLGLRASESIQRTLEKSDYGQRVHRILQAFHSDMPGLSGPFTALIKDDNLKQAKNCLETISQEVFAHDLEDNAIHRGWLQQWLKIIPAYLEWQQQRQSTWRPSQLEVRSESVLPGHIGITLNGRIDRIDKMAASPPNQSAASQAIIDYKTGTPPAHQDIIDGEAVQLPFYALLNPSDINQVEYLQLGKITQRFQARTTTSLEGDELASLSHQHLQRLQQLYNAMQAAEPLPAWGDWRTCHYCDMAGLCRRQIWEGSKKLQITCVTGIPLTESTQ